MPSTDPYQSIRRPALGDAPNIETAVNPAVEDLVTRTVMRFASANARGAVLTGPQAPVQGMVTYLVAENRLEMYDGTKWVPITSGAWQPITFNSPYVAYSGSPSYRLVNGSVELRGLIGVQSNGVFNLQAFHDITTLPLGYRPSAIRYFTLATEWVSQTTARAEVQANGLMRILTPGPSGNAPHWISLDAVSFNAS